MNLRTLILLLNGAFYVTKSNFKDAHDLSKWFVVPASKLTEYHIDAADYFAYSWILSLRHGKPWAQIRDDRMAENTLLPFAMEHSREFAGNKVATKTDDGWLIGFDEGEFGGSLWWFSPEGAQRAKISNAQVHGFVRTQTGLFALSGVAHLGGDEGQILVLDRDMEGKWTATTFVNLHQDPLAVTPDTEGNLIVVAHRQLVRVDTHKQITTLIEESFWQYLYPFSIVQTPDKSIYIGMRHGVARVYQTGSSYSVDWLLPYRTFLGAKRLF